MIKLWNNGFAELIGSYGNARSVVLAASECTGKQPDTESLLRRLIREAEGFPTTSFEFAVLHYRIKAPAFVFGHLVRHRLQSMQVRSARYTVQERDYWIPDFLEGDQLEQYKAAIEACYDTYDALIASGVKREIARAVLPQARYVQWQSMINTRALMTLLRQRLSPRAQRQTRELAGALYFLWEAVMPKMATAFLSVLPPRQSEILEELRSSFGL